MFWRRVLVALVVRSASRLAHSVTEDVGEALYILAQRGYVSIPKAALILRIHKYTLASMIEKGLVSTISVGARQALSRQEIVSVLAYLDKQKQNAEIGRNLSVHTEETLQRFDRLLNNDKPQKQNP